MQVLLNFHAERKNPDADGERWGSTPCSSTPCSRHSRIDEVQEVAYQQLQMQKLLGEGSYGKVRSSRQGGRLAACHM